MKERKLFRPLAGLILITLFTCISFTLAGERQVIQFNDSWKFMKGNPPGASGKDFNDDGWEDIRLPHDWAIKGPFNPQGDGGTGKLPWQGEGWYRKQFQMKKEDSGRRFYLLFDGVMACPQVYVNGEKAGQWDYGYNSFFLDISELVTFGGKNSLAVHVDTRRHGSRWYPGAGIYRKVTLLVTDPVHVPVWGTFVTTPDVHDNWADVRIQTTVRNSGSVEVKVSLVSLVMSPEGIEVKADTAFHTVSPGEESILEQWMTLAGPEKWDIEHPDLYTLRTIVKKDGQDCDIHETPFGVRSIRFSANDGFYLNGRRVQFRGVNLHHDQGPLGAAFLPRAMERQLEIMKEMGCNAIRTSHNVPAPELLDLCDRMGFLVFDEAFDKYDDKADWLPEMDFENFGERNIRNFIMRDRNHPCIVIWSVCNEEREVQDNKNGGLRKLEAMTDFVRKYDPTRPVTMACDMPNTVKWRHFDYYDVHSWNYGRRYAPARLKEPGKAVIISESASTVSTRGFYELPLPAQKTDFTDALQVSSYDLNSPRWAEIPDDDFMWVEDEGYICGEFVWTGFDYLGEPTPYSDDMAREGRIKQEQVSRSSYFGIVDLCGIPKDRYYLYRSHWAPEKVTVHILPHWNWEERKGKPVPVFVYTNGEGAELFLNGRSLGKRWKQPKAENSVDRYRLRWENVIYEPGELKAVAYREGKVIGEALMRTAGEPYRIKLTPDRPVLQDNGDDLSYILVEAFDRMGTLCPLADNRIQFKVTGPAVIAGVGNGNPQSLEPFIANDRKLFNGKAMLIIRSKEGEKGKIRISASSAGLKSAEVSVLCE